jgi:hypothetical protein
MRQTSKRAGYMNPVSQLAAALTGLWVRMVVV